jgi:acyl-CoA reductase-like NAD-dependent aldehyde dehydrogenase
LWKQVGCNRNETIYWARKPDGVVTVSPPKNASASNSLTAAFVFLGGNTLIVKPPLRAPIATIFLWKEIVNKALEDNKAPAGTLNIILGNSKHITDQWIGSPKVNDIYMFGDSKMGLEIGRRCYEVGKKPILELSGNDSLFVWKECDVNGAVESSIDAFLGSTQICMVPKTIVVHQDIYDTYIEKLLERISQLKYGLPSDDETYFTPVIKVDDFFIFLEDAKLKGASVLCGGNRVDHTGAIDNRGAYVQPTVVSIENYEKALEMLCVREENFFPLLPVMKISSDKQGKQADEDIFNKMIAFARLNEYGLRASAWVSSFYYTRQFIKHLDNSGLLRINSRHVNFSSFLSTHGGTGKSGGPFGEMSYIWQKTTHLQGISLTRERRRRNVGNVGIERRCLTP